MTDLLARRDATTGALSGLAVDLAQQLAARATQTSSSAQLLILPAAGLDPIVSIRLDIPVGRRTG